MPEPPPPKHHQHPLRDGGHARIAAPSALACDAPRVDCNRTSPKETAERGCRTQPRKWGELVVLSNYTFLTGASHPEELVEEAARLGHSGIALTDIETFGGSVRAHVAAKSVRVPVLEQSAAGGVGSSQATRFQLAHGTRVRLNIDSLQELAPDRAHDFTRCAHSTLGLAPHLLEVVLYATDRRSWAMLCLLLTRARSRAATDALDRTACDDTANDITAPMASTAARGEKCLPWRQ